MAFMYDYLTESELEIEKELRRNEVESLRLVNAMEAVVMRHELDIHQIEAKAVFENYSEDTLAAEYEREYNVYTEGVKEAWEKFKQWLKNIINAILGRNKENNNAEILQSADEVDLDYDPNAFVKFIDSVVSATKQFFTFKKVGTDGNSEVDKAKVTIAGIGTVVGVGGIITAFTKFKDTKSKIKTKVKDLPKISDMVSGALTRLKNVVSGSASDNADGGIKSKVISIVSEIVNFGKSFVDKIGNLIKKFTKGGKTTAEEESGEDGSKTGDENGSNSGTNEEPPASQEDKPEKSDSNEQKPEDPATKPNVNKKDIKAVKVEMIEYSKSHGYAGLSDGTIEKIKAKKNFGISSNEMANVYNAAKKNGDVNADQLSKWKDVTSGMNGLTTKFEFVGDDIIVSDISIFESMGLGDIDHMADDDCDIDEMLESTDTGLLDEINDIFDEFFS